MSDNIAKTQPQTSSNCLTLTIGTLLATPSPLTTGDPIQCPCGAILHALPEGMTSWTCAFCLETMSQFDLDEIPQSKDQHYILERAVQEENVVQSSPMVIFAIDISGSMSSTTEVNGKHVSRLDCMKAAVCEMLQKLERDDPECAVGVITFGSAVTLFTGKTQRCVASNLMTRPDELVKKGDAWCTELKPAKDVAGLLVTHVMNLTTTGATALGPAAALALGLASNQPGAAVLLATDGAANVGCGANVDKPFYTKMAKLGKENGTIVSTITVDGEEVGLEQLGLLSDITGGQVDLVDPSDMGKRVLAMMSRKVLATAVKAKLLTNAMVTLVGAPKSSPHEMVFDVGTATADVDLCVRFEPTNEARDAVNSGGKAVFQLQVEFTLPSGDRQLRVQTQELMLTTSVDEHEKSTNGAVLALETLQRSAALANDRNYRDARIALISTQRALQRTMAHGISDDLAKSYLAFVHHAEELDGFQREAEEQSKVYEESARAARDDDAQKSILSTKSISMRQFAA